MASSSAPAKSQYQHFIPRFILKNFAHPYKPLKSHSEGARKGGRRRRIGGYYPGDPMLHTINLAGTTAEVIESPVSRTFGQTDMYRDFAGTTNQHYLEEQLSKLEARASSVIQKINQAFEAGNQEVRIIRSDRDILRKFLFIMKYRGSGAHERFFHQDADSYTEDDKERIWEYMQRKGLRKPIDVWFDNIKAMLELKMDPEMRWMEWLMEHAYPDDAKWFINHSQMFYLALCTPSIQGDEFLLTENAYSVHEGPNSFSVNPHTNERAPTAYTELHVFSVISPKLMIVLRSFILPVMEEDANQEIRTWREEMYRLNAVQHGGFRDMKSLLAELPITKAENSYTRIVNGRTELLDGEDGLHRLSDSFCFRFFPISTMHTQRINSIMLDNSYGISTIAFKSRLAARKALDHYLRMPCEDDGVQCFKIVGQGPDDPRLLCLKKLEHAVAQMGSTTTAVYTEEKVLDNFEQLGRMLAKNVPKEPDGIMKPYMELGYLLAMIDHVGVLTRSRWKSHKPA